MALRKKEKMNSQLVTTMFTGVRAISTTHFSLRARVVEKEKRVAITVSAKVAPTAVARNTARRKVSHIITPLLSRIRGGCLMVVSVRKVPLPPPKQVQEELLFLFGKFAILV